MSIYTCIYKCMIFLRIYFLFILFSNYFNYFFINISLFISLIFLQHEIISSLSLLKSKFVKTTLTINKNLMLLYLRRKIISHIIIIKITSLQCWRIKLRKILNNNIKCKCVSKLVVFVYILVQQQIYTFCVNIIKL